MITFPDSSHLQQCSQKSCFSFLPCTGASPDLPGLLGLGEDGWRSDCGWRRVQEADAKQDDSSKWQNRGGIWGSWKPPKQGKGERSLLFSVQISALPPFLHASLFQSQTGCQIPSQPLIVCWFLNLIPHLGL